MEELKPCPFCGGKAEVRRLSYSNSNDDMYFVFCPDRYETCFVQPCTHRFVSREKAIEVWNERADKKGADLMENMTVNNAREKALLEMYKAIERAAIAVDCSIQMAPSAPSILTMCEACVRLESVGKPDALEKAYERVFAMNKPNETPKAEGETGNDGRNLGASDVKIGD